MFDTETERKRCLADQTRLRSLLGQADRFEAALRLFFEQHARLHSRTMAGGDGWSFEDDLLADVSEAQARWIPDHREHSLVWILWHIARCEDITMNLLVAGDAQVLDAEWQARIRSPIWHSGNAMDPAAVDGLSQAVDLAALRAYRAAVGQRTRAIAGALAVDNLKRTVNPARIQCIWDEGAVLPAASEVVDYWARRDVAGLLLMPATRHCLIHLNEALQIKKRRR